MILELLDNPSAVESEDSKKDLTRIANYMSAHGDFTKTFYIGCVNISSKFKFLRQMFSWK